MCEYVPHRYMRLNINIFNYQFDNNHLPNNITKELSAVPRSNNKLLSRCTVNLIGVKNRVAPRFTVGGGSR